MHVCIATGTRADWGILTPLAAALRDREDIRLSIIATNMHLMPEYGMTVSEITGAGFKVDAGVDMRVGDVADTLRVPLSMARCTDGMARALDSLRPDALVILGDRYEMLATASAALLMRIPVVHIAGGTVSYGAIDDPIRHAITQMASLHLTETDEHRRRVIQMGHHPDTVITTGALGVWNILHHKLMTQAELQQSLDGFKLHRDSTLLVTYHPATRDTAPVEQRFGALLEALDRHPGSNILFTYANNDNGGEHINRMIDAYAAGQAARVKVVPSLGMTRYLSALRYVAAVVGNSSSGIVEVPSMHIPTVDIGIRQSGRTAAASVIHCDDTADGIDAAIMRALDHDFRQMAAGCINPYEGKDTLGMMVQAIADLSKALSHNTFYDL